MKRLVLAAGTGLLAILNTAMAVADPLQHFSLTANLPTARLPLKVVLLPPDITVYSVAAGGVTERSEDRSTEAIKLTTQTVHDVLGNDKSVEIVALPAFDDASRGRLDEHIALYEQVVTAALSHATGPNAWPSKVERFDYTLGNGLRFLKERSGADAAVIVFSQSGVPTTSSYLANLPLLLVGVIALPQARAMAITGVIDLETGNMLWLNRAFAAGGPDNAVYAALQDYPTPTPVDQK